jgi:Tfp pilus assembly protein PilZ
MSNPIDFRQHPRMSPLIIRTQYRCGEVSGEGYLLNLCEGGAFLATHESFPIDETVELTISLPWQIGAIRVESRVVWRSDMIFETERELQPGAGLQFKDMCPAARDKLRNYIERFSRLASQIAD